MSEVEYIGRYRIVRPLGEGGMGRVMLAEVAGAGGFARRVVLKLVRDELDEALKQALLEEARITATLVHRNIVPVLDLHETGAQRLVVLEYIDGMDVRQLLQRVPMLDWPLAAFVAGEVAAALDFAHRRQIIHRDVSPANILVSWEGEVKLGDFGVAKVVGDRAVAVGPTMGLKGKLGYMAPEQMKRQPIDARADVYALGVVLYEMLTGKNPMRGGPIVPPPLPPSVPAALAAIVMRAVERNREDRFSSAADVREAILQVPGQPTDPPRMLAELMSEVRQHRAAGVDANLMMEAVLGGKVPTQVAPRKVVRARRRPWLWAMVATLVIVGAGAAGAWRTLRQRRAAEAKPTVVKLPPVVATPTKGPAPTGKSPAPTGQPAAPVDEETTAENAPEPPSETTAENPPLAEGEPVEERVAPGKPRAVRRPPARVHKAPKPQKGLLSVNAIPWANLYVDGKPAGHTPKLKLPLDAGHHSLKLVTQAGEARTRAIEINPNKETTLTVVFSEP